ncbi:MAG: NAD(P)-binding domain-containing protein [Gemmataceae bacterium]
MTKVCIIGAGSSGIVAAKTLHERGIPFDCFEKGSGVGGLWRYENDNGVAVAYQSLHINTSRHKMQFSDFPMPSHYPDFPHHTQIAQYFDSYVDHFGCRDRITFQTAVQHVQPLADGTFQVHTADRTGQRRSGEYRAVLVANGHHWHPRLPTVPGHFSGQTLHASRYRSPNDMVGKRVLVVGLGNSGCDIACEVSRVAERTFLAVRRGAHIIPKYLFGKTLDRLAPPWMWRYLPFGVFQWLFGTALRLAQGRLTKFRLPQPAHHVLEQHPTISSDLLNLIGHGQIQVKPNVKALAGSQVCFEDDSVEPVDVIVYATGYDIKMPFLDPQVFDTAENEVRLYKLVAHPQYRGLYFIGLVQPWGAIMPLAEEQSRWVADLLDGTCHLPSPAEMQGRIERDQAKMRKRYTASPRHTIQVDFYPYLDDLRRERRRCRQSSTTVGASAGQASRRRAA